MDKGAQLKQRAIRFLELFGIACLVMMAIRLLRTSQINPFTDPAASYALYIGLAAYILSKLMKAFF